MAPLTHFSAKGAITPPSPNLLPPTAGALSWLNLTLSQATFSSLYVCSSLFSKMQTIPVWGSETYITYSSDFCLSEICRFSILISKYTMKIYHTQYILSVQLYP